VPVSEDRGRPRESAFWRKRRRRRVGKGRSTCENSLIQPRKVHARRSRKDVKWGIPTPPVLEQVQALLWGFHTAMNGERECVAGSHGRPSARLLVCLRRNHASVPQPRPRSQQAGAGWQTNSGRHHHPQTL
jgi:hypothetical protein